MSREKELERGLEYAYEDLKRGVDILESGQAERAKRFLTAASIRAFETWKGEYSDNDCELWDDQVRRGE